MATISPVIAPQLLYPLFDHNHGSSREGVSLGLREVDDSLLLYIESRRMAAHVRRKKQTGRATHQ